MDDKQQANPSNNPNPINDQGTTTDFNTLTLLTNALDRQRVGMCLFDRHDKVVCWNKTYVEIFPEEADILALGLPYQETLRRFYEINLPAEELPFIERHIATGLKRHHDKHDPFVYQRKDGRWISNEPYWLENGGLLVMWRDITEGDQHGTDEWPDLKDALGDISVAFVLFNPSKGFVSANKAYADLFPDCVDLNLSGTSYHEHMQRHVETALDESERRRIDALLIRKMDSDEAIKKPMVFRRNNGGWLQLEERPTKSGGLICIWSDVTEQIEAQAQLATMQERLSDAIESLVDGFALFDSDDRLVICNSRYCELNPLSADLLVPGVRWLDFVRIGAERGQYLEAEGCIEEWLAQRQAHRQRADGSTFELQLNDGTWVRATDLRTRDGGTVGIRNDITDLKYSEQRFRTIAESIPVIINDAAGNLLYVSPPTAELFRTPVAKLMTWQAADFFADSEEHRRLAGEVVRTGKLENMEFSMRRGDDTVFPATGVAKRIIYDGKPAYINTLFDLSERKLAQQLQLAKQAAEEASRAQSQFLAHMSHELRTPLNAVLGYTQVLHRDRELNDKQRDNLAVIQTAGEHLLGLINDILDFIRIESRKLEVNNGVFNLRQFLQSTEQIFQFKADEKKIAFQIDIAPDIPPIVSGDVQKLRQIIFNLIGNAIKFTATGQVDFSVRQDPASGLIRFTINDTGTGIRDQDLERIFQPFQQVAGKYTEMPEGTGLGLTISRNMVELLGGVLNVESELGRGSQFWFEIELLAADDVGAFEYDDFEYNNRPIDRPIAASNDWVYPEVETLIMLSELARQGDVKPLIEQAQRLQQDERYRAFALELQSLAKSFQVKKIIQLLESETE